MLDKYAYISKYVLEVEVLLENFEDKILLPYLQFNLQHNQKSIRNELPTTRKK